MPELTLTIQKIAIWAIPLLFAITVHEVAHGWVASKLGDQTARLAGRLTLNPIKHIDMVGTILVPLVLLLTKTGFIFGWAKPVPVDARNLHNPKRDRAIVAAAGPVSNLLMAFIWAFIAKIGYSLLGSNDWLGVPLVLMGNAGIMVNIVLGVLNCLPIPPLDGSRVLYNLLPPRAAYYLDRIEPYGLIILILLMLSPLWRLILFPIYYLQSFIAILFGLA
jgi:Zn-dependent protease